MINNDVFKYIEPSRIIDIQSDNKKGALQELINVICQSPEITDRKLFKEKIFEREKYVSTGIGYGIAIPHIRDNSIKDFVMALGRKREGMDYEAIDNKPVRLIFMIGGNNDQKDKYINFLSQLTTKLKDQNFKNSILKARGPDQIYEIVQSKL